MDCLDQDSSSAVLVSTDTCLRNVDLSRVLGDGVHNRKEILSIHRSAYLLGISS